MRNEEGCKVWHALNAKKSKYFLVDVLPLRKQSDKMVVSFHGDRYQVLADEIFQYDPDKPDKITELKFINEPQIMEWIQHHGGQKGWVPISPKVVLDFNTGTQTKRKQYLSFLLSRFLVGVKSTQYICISNDPLVQSQDYTVHGDIIEAIGKVSHLWPYAISLESLDKLYNAFFTGTPIKFKIFIKEQQIIKLSLQVFALGSKQCFGSAATDGVAILELKPKIFQILNGSSQELKRYFKVPEKPRAVKSSYSVNNLVDCMLSLGLKVPEINNLIELFSIIMNINELQMIKFKTKSGYTYKIKQSSQAKSNLTQLIGDIMLDLLEKQFNSFETEEELTVQNIIIKQQVLMWLIWKESLNFVAEVMNNKLVNLDKELTEDVKKLVFIQFPAIGQEFQRSVQNYSLEKINSLIKRVALNLPVQQKQHKINMEEQQTIMERIKQENTYDINKKILRDMEKQVKQEKKLKQCTFMKEFRIKKYPNSSNKQNNKENRINKIVEEISMLQEPNSTRCANFIIRSELNISQQPSNSLLSEVKESLQQGMREKKQKRDAMLQAEFVDYQNGKDSDENINAEEWVEMTSKRFKTQYHYCEMIRQFRKQKLQVYEGCQRHFNKYPESGRTRKLNNTQMIYLSESCFQQLEKDRKNIGRFAIKIQKQWKKYQQRKNLLEGLHTQYVKIRLYKWLCLRTYPLIKDSFKDIRKGAAINKIEKALIQYCFNIQRPPFKKLKKRSAVIKIGDLEENIYHKSIRRARIESWNELRQIKKRQKYTESVNLINQTITNMIIERETEFMARLQIISNQKKKNEATSCLLQVFDKIRMKNQRQSYTKIKEISIAKHEKNLRQMQKQQEEKKEKEMLQKQKIEKQKIRQQKLENERLENERPENKRIENERHENEKIENEKHENKRIENDRPENKRIENERLEKQQKQKQKIQQQNRNQPQPQLQQNKNQSRQPPPISTSQQPPSQSSQPVIYVNQPQNTQSNPPPISPVSSNNQINTEAADRQRKYSAQNMDKKSTKPKKKDNDVRSNAASSVCGNERSEDIIDITKDQLYILRDCPKFSFDIWNREAVGFQKRKPVQVQKKGTVPQIFNKPELDRPSNKDKQQELDVDILIKEKVVVNPFFPYLVQHVGGGSDQNLNNLMSHQHSVIKQPILKRYPLTNYKEMPITVFNNILKLGKDKNSTKSKLVLLNEIVKNIQESYYLEKKNIANVIDNEPALIIDYSWEHNIVKDEIFIQIIKQLMQNDINQSLKELFSVLEILTRYFYPSPQFLYAFIYYMKSLQSKNLEMVNQVFTNVLLFAQAYEKYKGNNVTVLKNELTPKQKESYMRLESRVTSICEEELKDKLTIKLSLINNQIFEYKVRNETISYFRRKLLKDINFLQYQEYFGVYHATKKQGSMNILNEYVKTVDFLINNPQTATQNVLYVKLKYYFPFNLKQINKTKLFYLNSVVEERYLPWKKQQYENVVALAMMFDDFEEYRIGQYLKLTDQVKSTDVNLKPIEDKYGQLTKNKGQKICELQYFRTIKESNFLAAKGYRMKDVFIFNNSNKVSRLVIKPLQLCLYEGSQLMASINLKRIKYHLLEKGEIYLEIDYNEKGQNSMRSVSLKGVDRVAELYQDLVAYINYLSPK